jgi:hypothetical protein
MRVPNGSRGRLPGRLAARVIAACVVLSMAGCKQLEWIEKKSPPEVPGEEKARLEHIKKEAGPSGTRVRSVLRTTPEAMDFGDVPLGSERTQAIVNPAAFDVTVVGIVLEGDGFTTENRAERVALPARDQFVLTIRFRPLKRGAYTGGLLLEIDASGGRFTRVSIKGYGAPR